MKSTPIVLALFAASLSAQVATLTGRITDSSGAVIPQAKILVRSLGFCSEDRRFLPARPLARTVRYIFLRHLVISPLTRERA